MRKYKKFPDSYEKLYGRYLNRAFIGYSDIWQGVIIAIIILAISQNVFYFLLFCGYARIKFILTNHKNRQFEILNRLDELEELIKNKGESIDEDDPQGVFSQYDTDDY